MPKFRFALQNVIKHRQIKEDLAQKDFMDALAILRQEEQKLQNMQQTLTQSFHQEGQHLRLGGAPAPALQQINEFKKLQEIRIRIQKSKVQEAEKIVEDRREILRLSALDTKIIEKYREKKFEDWKHEMKIEEQNEMDEMSILRYESGEQDS